MTVRSADDHAVAALPREAVGPLIRGLAVLRELAITGGRRPVSELARATALARSTVDRVISTLEHLGYARLDGRDAVLTPRLMELGNAYLAASGIPDLLAPIADALAGELDESVSLAVPDEDGVRFVHQRTRRRAMSLTYRIGDLLPAELAAAGALFAADWTAEDWARWERRRAAAPARAGFPALPHASVHAHASFRRRTSDARERGWSPDDQLIEPGLIAVAAPVRGPAGRQVCAAGVVSHTSRHTADSLARAVLPRLRETVAAMERRLAAPAEPPAPVRADETAARAREAKRELGPEFVESLARGLAVLTALGRPRAATIAELADVTGLPRATVRRSLITLEPLGYVTGQDGRFRLTPRVLELGFACLSRPTLPQIAQPHLAALVEQVHESASMSVLDGDEIHYIARVPTVRIMSVTVTVGTRFPAYATSMGRVLLAGLPEDERARYLARADLAPLTPYTVTSPDRLARILTQVSREGHAMVNEELEEGLRSIAVPIHDRTGQVIAAVNVSTHAARTTPEESLATLLPPLREAAAAVEADLCTAGRYVTISSA